MEERLIVILLIIATVGFSCCKNELMRNEPIQEGTKELVQTADWNTYTNERYGYLIKYPRDWYSEIEGETIYFKSSEEEKLESRRSVIKIEVINDSSLKSYLKMWGKQWILSSEEAIIVSGVKGVKKVADSDAVGVSMGIFVFLSKGGKTYIISIAAENNANQVRFLRVFDQVLSTFKFTKK